MRDGERERLILDVLPQRYVERAVNPFGESDVEETAKRLAKAYRVALASSSDELRKKAIQKYVKILRESDGEIVNYYDEAFFDGEDLTRVSTTQALLVKEHFLDKLSPVAAPRVMHQMRGVERYLTPADAASWIDPILKALTSDRVKQPAKKWMLNYVEDASSRTPSDFDEAAIARLDGWESHWTEEEPDVPGALESVKEMRSAFRRYVDDDLPF
jgi:hypothetical protein